MTQISVQLSDEMKALMDQRIAEDGYKSASDLFETLLRRDEERLHATDDLEKVLLEGLDSGSAPLTAADWQEMRREVSS